MQLSNHTATLTVDLTEQAAGEGVDRRRLWVIKDAPDGDEPSDEHAPIVGRA